MGSILLDLRYGVRMLRKQPASSAIAVIALALGIGLTTLMFSIVYGAFLRGLPFEKPGQLLSISSSVPEEGRFQMEMTPQDFAEMRGLQKSFEDLSASFTSTLNLSDGERPERYDGAFITPSAFALLRVQPVLGRNLQDSDNLPGAPDVMVISHTIWATRFQRNPGVTGTVIRANGKPTTIVGVMPEKFGYPHDEQVWLPLHEKATREAKSTGSRVDVMGRLRDNISIEAASAELNGIAQQFARAYPATNKGVGVTVKPYIESSFGAEPIAMLYTMLGAVFMVLLIACTNVANLLISRAATRSKEIGVRTALGASKIRIIRQFLAESLMISLGGAAIGVAIAVAGMRLFNNAIVDTHPPFWIDVKLDGGMLLFVLATTLLATLLAGGFPAFNATRTSIGDVLKDESRGSSSLKLGRLTRALVVFEIALSAGLLVGAGLMIKSVTRLSTVDYGFDTRNIFTARINLSDAQYPDAAERQRFFESVLARVRALPGVQMAALTNALPGVGSGRSRFAVEGRTYPDEKYPFAGEPWVTPDFFAVLDVKPIAGRVFTDAERKGSPPVAIVSQAFAQRQFGRESAIGRRVQVNPGKDSREPMRTIVGVVPDMYINGLTDKDQSGIMLPIVHTDYYGAYLIARVNERPLEMTSAVRAAVAAIDPDQPIFSVMTLQGAIDLDNWFYRVFGSLFMSFGIAALFLASVGLYGVMATSVSHRTREMGVRMALGASTSDVLKLVMGEGMLQLAIGLTLGLAFALGMSRLLSMLLFQVEPRDPATFMVIGFVLALTATAASLIPARRATRVQPLQAMRSD